MRTKFVFIIAGIAAVFLVVVLLDDPPKDCTWQYEARRTAGNAKLLTGRCVPNKPTG